MYNLVAKLKGMSFWRQGPYIASGVACLNINVCNCVYVVNAFMQKLQKGAFTNSVVPNERPLNVALHVSSGSVLFAC